MTEIAGGRAGLYRDGFAMRRRVINAPMFGSQPLRIGLSFGTVCSVFSFVTDISLEGPPSQRAYTNGMKMHAEEGVRWLNPVPPI